MSDKIPIHLQATGSYEYRCRKIDCWYCDMMNPITLEPPIVQVISGHETVIIKEKKPKVKYRIVKQTAWPKFRSATMFKKGANN